MKTVLSLICLAFLASCGPIVGEGAGPVTAAAPPVPRRFGVELPYGWHEVSHSDIGEAGEAQYEDEEFGARMRVSLLIFADSISATLAAEADRLRRRGWKTHSLDADASDGMVSLVGYTDARQTIVRVARPEICPTNVPCVAVFAGSWPSGYSGEGSIACEYIQASFRIIPSRRSP